MKRVGNPCPTFFEALADRRSNYCCQHSLTLVDEKKKRKRTIEETQRRINCKVTMEICRLLVATIHFNNPLNGGRQEMVVFYRTIRTLLLNGDRH